MGYPRGMNVLFIMTDQMRADCLSAVGHPVVNTPRLDALAQQGVLFRNAFVNSAVCGPSRMCFYTGRYPHATRSPWNEVPLPAEERTVRGRRVPCRSVRQNPLHPGPVCRARRPPDQRHPSNDPRGAGGVGAQRWQGCWLESLPAAQGLSAAGSGGSVPGGSSAATRPGPLPVPDVRAGTRQRHRLYD